ncbi:hypothetical protein EDB86DRAFT_2877659 [Lactarius hatsudake]|nr:hypothetical protein EDB86DRAFT_2877659 [Lactarius hatsudake]
MSAESIARWNAIPMTRPEDVHDGLSAQFASTKRHRDDDESDGDVSLVSRSPSPVPQDQMDIDKYDDYVRGPVRDVITVDTKIKSTNKGFEMLSKLGWVEGQPLGLSQDARVDPIPFNVKNDATGLGKTSQDFRMIETTVSQRRELDSERQRNETEEQRKAREGNVARRAALQTEISEVLRPFYCTICDKQFQITQRAKQNTPEEQDKRKEKERKREEKELRKIAAAAGVKMAKSMANAPTLAPVSTPGESKSPGFKKGGWASVDSAPTRATGWGAAGSSARSPSPAPDAVSSSGGLSTTPVTAYLGDTPIREQVQYDQRQLHQPAPAFRTAGWSSIDGTTQPQPPPLPVHDVPAMAVTDEHHHPDQGPSSTSPTSSIPAPVPVAGTAAPEAMAPRSFKSKKERESTMRENARSGWQSFQKGGRRK